MAQDCAQLAVSFGSPHWGWLPLEVRSKDQILSLEASAVPNDFLAELASAVCMVATAQGRATATANEEPTEVEFAFLRTGQQVELMIHRRTKVGESMVVKGSLAEVVLPFWRALRRLQSDKAFEHHWNRPFPLARMNRLSELVADIKADAG